MAQGDRQPLFTLPSCLLTVIPCRTPKDNVFKKILSHFQLAENL
jgi:hypothetical protein